LFKLIFQIGALSASKLGSNIQISITQLINQQ